MFKENTKGLKVLTPDGYKSFKGVQKLTKQGCIVKFDNGKELKCCIDHPLCVDVYNFEFKKAKHLTIGEKIFHKDDGWVGIKEFEAVGEINVYDLIEVEDTISYYTNGFLSHNCEWINSGESSIDDALYEIMEQQVCDPMVTLDDGCYKVWEEAQKGRIYAAGVDTAEGVGKDSSVVQMLDITDPAEVRQVAVYRNNKISPMEFSNKVYNILRNYGSPLALVERNNCGAQVVDRLAHDMGYPKLVSYGNKAAHRKNRMQGMIAHTNTKHKGVINMRYWMNDLRSVIMRDAETLEELRSFVRYPNGTWKARQGCHDDLVMALMYGYYVLDNDICEQYFEIIEKDDTGRPKIIEPLDFGVSLFEDPTSIYTDNEVTGGNPDLNPIYWGMSNGEEDMGDDYYDLLEQGYTPL